MRATRTLDLGEAAELLHLHPNTLRERTACGDIPGAKIGRSWGYIEDDLLVYMREQYPVKAPSPCSTSKRTAKSGGRTFVTTDGEYVRQLENLISERRKSAKTSSR